MITIEGSETRQLLTMWGDAGRVRVETQGSEADPVRSGRLAKDRAGRLQPLGAPCRTRGLQLCSRKEHTPVRFRPKPHLTLS